MTAPHVASDDTAILAAHDHRLANAGMSLDAAVRAFKAKARREHLERVIQALKGYHDEYVAGLERTAGREPGSFGRVEVWEDGPRPQNDFGSRAL